MAEGLDKDIIDLQTGNLEINTLNLIIINSIKQAAMEYIRKLTPTQKKNMKFKDFKLSMRDYSKISDQFEESKDFSEHPLIMTALKVFSYIKLVSKKKMKFQFYLQEREDALKNESNKKIAEEDLVCYKFLRNVTCCVEIKRNNDSTDIFYFHKMSKCGFLSENSRNTFLKDVDRTSVETKLAGLYDEMDYFITEMDHNQKVFSKNLFFYKYFGSGNSFYNQLIILLFSAAINLILVTNLNQTTISGGKFTGKQQSTVKVLGICEIVVTIINFILLMVLIYPLQKKLCAQRFLDDNADKKSLNIFDKVKIYVGDAFFFQPDVFTYIYHLFCLIMALTVSEAFYSLDLLALVNLSRTLKYVLRSTTEHISHVAATLALSLFVMYAYGMIVSFYFFNEMSDSQSTCSSVWLCFLTLIDSGFTNGQGTAGITNQPAFVKGNYNKFYGKFFVDMTFFLIINTIFLNIIFGIIIDTFGEMRAQNQFFGI